MRHFAEFGLVLTQAYMIFHALSPTTPSEVAAIFFLWPKTAHNQKKEQKQNKRKQKKKKKPKTEKTRTRGFSCRGFSWGFPQNLFFLFFPMSRLGFHPNVFNENLPSPATAPWEEKP